jgi:predicted RNase H-like nuclease (RuvC/YqgF family)
MRLAEKFLVLGFTLVCLAAAVGYGQQQPSESNGTSLGDIARQLKAQRTKEPKPVVVMTNDTLNNAPQGGELASKKPTATTSPAASATTEKHDAEYYRSHQSKLQDQLALHQRELSVLQQKLGQNQMQYYPNPQDSLMQQYKRSADYSQSDIGKLNAEIDAKKQQIDDDQKALDDLSQQLRQEGGDPSWLRQ